MLKDTYQQSLENTKNSHYVKDESFTSKKLTQNQIKTIKDTRSSIDNIKESTNSITDITQELIEKIVSI